MMLEGIRVLDLSRVIAGPYCAMLLGDLGAEVVKLERPGHGDDLRYQHGRNGMSAAFAALNRNKRGVAVDLQHPEGARLGFELARRADVIVENFVPGVADRLGLGYDAVRAANPGIVYASITGFVQDGPYARRPGYNLVVQGMSGMMAINGMPEDPPTRVGFAVADVAAAFLAFGAVNGALFRRARTGLGQHVDVSLLAASLALMPDPIAHYFGSGVKPERAGNRNPHQTPAEPFRTRDGYVTVVLMNPDQWGRFCRVVGVEALSEDPRFATNADRLAHHDELRARIEAALVTASTAEWVARFERASIAAGPIYDFDQVFEDPHVRHTGLLTQIEQPGYGAVRMLDFPVGLAGAPRASRRPAPRLGEHTAEVLREVGLSSDEVGTLAASRAIMLAEPLAGSRVG